MSDGKLRKRPIVVLVYELGEIWATDEELAEMTDDEVIELLHEDLIYMLENCTWTVIRRDGTSDGRRRVDRTAGSGSSY